MSKMDNSAKIFTVFTARGLYTSTQTYSLHNPDQKVLSNQEILAQIKERSPGIEFIGETEPVKPEYAFSNIAGQKKSLDGVLYFGAPSRELLKLDLPTVAVYPLWAQWQPTYNSYKENKVLTASLPIIPDASDSTFSARLEDIAGKLKLIRVIEKMKGLKILVITDKPTLGLYEPEEYQFQERGAYEETYLNNLLELGCEVVVRPQLEMISRMKAIDGREAEKIAKKWIDGAKEIKGTNEKEIKKSARLYLAMKEMMDEFEADAITTEGYAVFMYGDMMKNLESDSPSTLKGDPIPPEDLPIPSQGLPSSQFCTDGVVATSETLLDSLVTQELGLLTTGSTGFNGDYIIDESNDKVYIGHCECPFNPYGNEKKAPYVIRNLPQWPVEEQKKGGACVQVDLPTDEIVTVAKVSVHDKKIALFTGKTKNGEELFTGWNDILCRTKLAIDADAKTLLKNVDWSTFGNHRVVFFGDYRREFKNLAKLIGFDIVEPGG